MQAKGPSHSRRERASSALDEEEEDDEEEDEEEEADRGSHVHNCLFRIAYFRASRLLLSKIAIINIIE